MNFKISTEINRSYQFAADGFNKKLFQALAPVFPILTLERYDGEKTGDEVHISMNLLVCKQQWVSVITQGKIDKDQEIIFIDEGKVLPWPLRSWKHRHIVKKNNDNSCFVIDDVTYSTGNKFFDFLILPSLFVQFVARKNKYKKYFSGL